MPRTVSLTAMRSALAQSTQEVWVVLLKISHSSLPTPIYLCDDTQSHVNGGNTFLPFPFKISLPEEDPEKEPRLKLVFSNVDRRLIDEIRSLTGGPTIEVRIVLASSPSQTEYGPLQTKVKEVTYNAEAIQMTLGFESYAAEPIPWTTFSPGNFPGLFT